jgi:hypothetical protein
MRGVCVISVAALAAGCGGASTADRSGVTTKTRGTLGGLADLTALSKFLAAFDLSPSRARALVQGASPNVSTEIFAGRKVFAIEQNTPNAGARFFVSSTRLPYPLAIVARDREEGVLGEASPSITGTRRSRWTRRSTRSTRRSCTAAASCA